MRSVKKLTVLVITCVILIALAVLPACAGDQDAQTQPRVNYPKTPDASELTQAEGINRFAFRFYETTRNEQTSAICSPYSLGLVMSMLYAGTVGKTRSEIASCFGYKLSGQEQNRALARLQSRIRDAVYAGTEPRKLRADRKSRGSDSSEFTAQVWSPYENEPFTPEYNMENILTLPSQLLPIIAPQYRKVLTKYYGASLMVSGSEKPNHPAKDASLRLSSRFSLNLPWKTPFRKADTALMRFYPEFKPEDQFPTLYQMMKKQARFGYGEREGLQILEMPYLQEDFCLRILLPERLSEFEQNFTYASYREILSGITTQEVLVFIPQFTRAQRQSDLIPVFRKLGVISAFDFNQSELTGIFKTPPNLNYAVTGLSQQSIITLDEAGTNAMSLTDLKVAGSGIAKAEARGVKMFLADHPFIYLLVHKPTDCILFMGSLR